MTMSMSDLRTQLSDIEPSESTYEGIGPGEVGLLRELLDDEEPFLAARAVHALSRIDAREAGEAIRAAAASPRIEVRIAAASAAENLHPELSDEILPGLLQDAEIGVRKTAVKSVSERNAEPIKVQVREMIARERNPRMQKLTEVKARALDPRDRT